MGRTGGANARCHRICLVVAKGKSGRQGSLPDAQAICMRAESGEVQGARIKEGPMQIVLGTHLVLSLIHI